MIADDWDDLTDGQLSHPIDRFADGEPANEPVWTSTQATGEAIESDDFCGDWSLSGETNGRIGATTLTDFEWTDRPIPSFCVESHSLYCFRD